MDLRDYLRLLRKGRLLIVLCAVAGVTVAALMSVRSPRMYSSSVTMVVSSPDSGQDSTDAAYQGNLLSQQRVKSYADLVASDRIAGAVITQLKLPESSSELRKEIAASAVPDTVLLKATVTDRSPARAQQIANGVGIAFSGAVADIEAPDKGKAANVRVSVWEPAKLPSSPVSPKPVRDSALGLVVGIVFGIGLAVLRDRLDTTVRAAHDVTAATDAPVLGSIQFDGDSPRHPLVVQAGPHSARAEAFRQLRTNLRFVDVDGHPRTIIVTSSVPREGKTTTSCNLAITLAQAGLRVALVEGDLRRPSFSDYLGIESAVGLTSVLIGAATLDDALQPWGDGRLQLLPSGIVPPNPSELLGSEGMADLLRTLRSEFDMVIVDAPPLLPVTDAAVLAIRADGVLLVARAGKTRREQLRRAAEALRVVDARILGVVLNMVPTRGPDAYTYQYAYSYEVREEPVNRTPAEQEAPDALYPDEPVGPAVSNVTVVPTEVGLPAAGGPLANGHGAATVPPGQAGAYRREAAGVGGQRVRGRRGPATQDTASAPRRRPAVIWPGTTRPKTSANGAAGHDEAPTTSRAGAEGSATNGPGARGHAGVVGGVVGRTAAANGAAGASAGTAAGGTAAASTPAPGAAAAGPGGARSAVAGSSGGGSVAAGGSAPGTAADSGAAGESAAQGAARPRSRPDAEPNDKDDPSDLPVGTDQP